MKKLILSTLFIMCVASSFAQSNQAVKEPEFINNYCLMTSDTSFVVLPKKVAQLRVIRTRYPSGLRLLAEYLQLLVQLA